MKTTICDECNDEEASWRCKLCNKDLCDDCKREHLQNMHDEEYNENFKEL